MKKKLLFIFLILNNKFEVNNIVLDKKIEIDNNIENNIINNNALNPSTNNNALDKIHNKDYLNFSFESLHYFLDICLNQIIFFKNRFYKFLLTLYEKFSLRLKKIFYFKIILISISFFIILCVLLYNIPYKKIYQEKIILPKEFVNAEIYQDKLSKDIVKSLFLSKEDKEYFQKTSNLFFNKNDINNNIYDFTLEVSMNQKYIISCIKNFFDNNKNIYINFFSEKIGYKNFFHFQIDKNQIPINTYPTLYEENIHHTGRINTFTEDGEMRVNKTRCHIIAGQLILTYKMLTLENEEIKINSYKSLCNFNKMLLIILNDIKENSLIYNLLKSKDFQEYLNTFQVSKFADYIINNYNFKFNKNMKMEDELQDNIDENLFQLINNINSNFQNIINKYLHSNDIENINNPSSLDTRIKNATSPVIYVLMFKLYNELLQQQLKENFYKYLLPEPYIFGIRFLGNTYKVKLSSISNRTNIYLYPFVHFEASYYFVDEKKAEEFRIKIEEILKKYKAKVVSNLYDCWRKRYEDENEYSMTVKCSSQQYSLIEE